MGEECEGGGEEYVSVGRGVGPVGSEGVFPVSGDLGGRTYVI